MPSPRLLLFGIDGAHFELMMPWVEQGLLPNLAAVLQRSATGPLRSVIPPITPCAWTTMMTGQNAGRHGIYDFVLPKPGTYGRRLASALDRKSRPVWLLANDAGLSCGICNVPTTYPPDELNGYMVSGMIGTPDYRRDAVRPESLFSELQNAVGGFPMDSIRKTSRGYSLAQLDARVDNRIAAFTYLLENHPTDIFMGVVHWVDHIQHYFLGNAAWDSDGRHVDDMVLYSYQAADRVLGELLKFCGPETYVVITSDHGAAPGRAYLNIDRLLVDTGLLVFKSAEKASGMGRGGFVRSFAKMVPDWLRLCLPPRVRMRFIAAVRKEYEQEIDWKKTKIFRRYSGYGLDMNVEGREPEGIIPADQYEQARDEIITTLQEAAAAYPELQPFVLHKREDIYEGPHVVDSPDIIMDPAEYLVMVTENPSPKAGVVVSMEEIAGYETPKRFRIGTHHMDGVFIAAGPGIEPGLRIEGAQMADVTPTVLALAGAGVPPGLDGKALLTPSSQTDQAATWQGPTEDVSKVYSAEEEAEIEDRLRDLGYL